MKVWRLERWVAHVLGWHTPVCLYTTDPRRGRPRMVSPECQGPKGSDAKVWPLLGWHRWVTR